MTPLQFLNTIRSHIVMCNKNLTMQERSLISQVPIHYKALAQQNRLYLLDRLFKGKEHGLLMGSTDKGNYMGMGARELYIFGCDHRRDQEEMAKSLVHELGHVISNGWHDALWVEKVHKLGLEEHAYGKHRERVLEDGKLSGPWADPSLAAFVHSLPPIEWGELDHDAQVCFQQAIMRELLQRD